MRDSIRYKVEELSRGTSFEECGKGEVAATTLISSEESSEDSEPSGAVSSDESDFDGGEDVRQYNTVPLKNLARECDRNCCHIHGQ